MNLKFIFALIMVALGLSIGAYELWQLHWASTISAFVSGLIAAGIILIGREFITHSWIGAGLALLTAVSGFYSFLSENRALDVDLSNARYEAAVTLIQAKPHCANMPNSSNEFTRASHACFMQSNRDQLASVGEAAKQIYLPLEVGIADATYSALKKKEMDQCSSMITNLYQKCPEIFSSMKQASIMKLLMK